MAQKGQLTIQIPEQQVYVTPEQQIQTTSPETPENQEQAKFSYSAAERRMTVELKLEQNNDELLDLLEDELVVLQTIKQKLDKSIQKDDQIKYDIYLAEYCSIIQRTIQSLRILTQRKVNQYDKNQLNSQQTERLNDFCIQFNLDFKEYQKTWTAKMKNDFNNFMQASSPRHLETFHLNEEVYQIENYSSNISSNLSQSQTSNHEKLNIQEEKKASNESNSKPQEQVQSKNEILSPKNEMDLSAKNLKGKEEQQNDAQAIKKCYCLVF